MARKYSSYNSLVNSLSGLALLLSWAEQEGVSLEERLLSGRPLEPREIDRYCNWLEISQQRNTRVEGGFNSKTYNAKILYSKGAIDWFLINFHKVDDIKDRAHAVLEAQDYMAIQWAYNRKRTTNTSVAPDLTEGEISKIEDCLSARYGAASVRAADASAYLIWRLSIEFGLRIGEILALRVEDCPNRFSGTLRIVRVDERSPTLDDPRGVYAPRPKTLSRELAPILKNSKSPQLIHEYISVHRKSQFTTEGGRRKSSFKLNHPFLIVNQKGMPLPISTAKGIAARISESVGSKFHWHLARHAFFNRAWEAVAELDCVMEREVRVQDLVYWGGWSSSESLKIYARRAQKNRAANALAIWNGSVPSWNTLE